MTYRIRPGKDLTCEVVRIAEAQYDRAIEILNDQPAGRHQAIHDARKRFKKLRGLFRLVRHAAPDFYDAENARIRDMARTLSTVRDATALVETLDHLIESQATAENHDRLFSIRARLADRLERITREETDLDDKIDAAISSCGKGIKALAALRLPKRRTKATALLARGTARNYCRAVIALQTAVASNEAVHWHDLRKRIKYHRMHVRLMSHAWPGELRLRGEIADVAGEALGDDHDLACLETLIATDPGAIGNDEDIALLRSVMAARSAELRDQIRGIVKNLLRDDKRVVRKRLATLWRDAM